MAQETGTERTLNNESSTVASDEAECGARCVAAVVSVVLVLVLASGAAALAALARRRRQAVGGNQPGGKTMSTSTNPAYDRGVDSAPNPINLGLVECTGATDA